MPCPDLGDLRDWYEDTREQIEDAVEDVRDELQRRYDAAVASYNDYCNRINALRDKKSELEAYYNFLVDYEESIENINGGLMNLPYQEMYCDGLYYEDLTSFISLGDDPASLYSSSDSYLQSISTLKRQVDDDINALWTDIYIFQGYRDEAEALMNDLLSQI